MRFLIIDRILELKKGEMASGNKNPSYEECSLPRIGGIPDKMPRSLILEAIGQLGAWLIIVSCDFKVRPVIASFSRVEFMADVSPGDQLAIEVILTALREDSALVDGKARVGGNIIADLQNAIYTFMPLETLDEPEEVKAQYQALIRK